MPSDNIKVLIRYRPMNKRELSGGSQYAWKHDNTSVQQLHPRTLKPLTGGNYQFNFDHVYGPHTETRTMYSDVAKGIVESAMDGIHGTIFAYGQTSSGKTHTMMGTETAPGIIPLAIQEVFTTIRNNREREYLLRVSYMEIYNERITDLLDPDSGHLDVREDPKRGIFVSDLTEELVADVEGVLDVMARGEHNRHVASTKMNDRSSRSHTIFRVVVESREKRDAPDALDDVVAAAEAAENDAQGSGDMPNNLRRQGSSRSLQQAKEAQQEGKKAPPPTLDDGGAGGAVRVSYLNLVDLAGSERQVHTQAVGQRLREGAHINKSLLMLGQVIRKLTSDQGDGQHVPYRNSKLTRILQNALGGNSRTAIICTVTPASQHIDESSSTLKFANRAKQIKNRPHVNEILDERALLQRYRQKITNLQRELKSIRDGDEREQYVLEMQKENRQLTKNTTELEKRATADGKRASDAERRIANLMRFVVSAHTLSNLHPHWSESSASTTSPAFPMAARLMPSHHRRDTWDPSVLALARDKTGLADIDASQLFRRVMGTKVVIPSDDTEFGSVFRAMVPTPLRPTKSPLDDDDDTDDDSEEKGEEKGATGEKSATGPNTTSASNDGLLHDQLRVLRERRDQMQADVEAARQEADDALVRVAELEVELEEQRASAEQQATEAAEAAVKESALDEREAELEKLRSEHSGLEERQQALQEAYVRADEELKTLRQESAELVEMRAQCEKLGARVTELECSAADVKKRAAEVRELKTQLSKAQAEVRTLEKSVKEESAKASRLQQQRQSIEQQRDDLKSSAADARQLRPQLDRAQRDIDRERTAREKAEERLRAVQKEKSQLEQAKAQSKRQLVDVQQSHDAIYRVLNKCGVEFDPKTDKLQHALPKLQRQFDKWQADCDESKRLLAEAESARQAAMSELEEQVEAHEAELEEVRAEHTVAAEKSAGDRAALQEQIADLQRQLEQSRADSSQVDDLQAEFQAERERWLSEREQLEARVQSQSEMATMIQNEADATMQLMDELETARSEQKHKVMELEAAVDKERSLRTTAESELKLERERSAELQRTVDDRGDVELRLKQSDTERQAAEEELRGELKEQRKRLKEQAASMMRLSAEREELSSRVEQQAADLESMQRRMDELREQHAEALRSQHEAEVSAANDAELERSRRRLETVERELRETTQQRRDFEVQVAQLEAELRMQQSTKRKHVRIGQRCADRLRREGLVDLAKQLETADAQESSLSGNGNGNGVHGDGDGEATAGDDDEASLSALMQVVMELAVSQRQACDRERDLEAELREAGERTASLLAEQREQMEANFGHVGVMAETLKMLQEEQTQLQEQQGEHQQLVADLESDLQVERQLADEMKGEAERLSAHLATVEETAQRLRRERDVERERTGRQRKREVEMRDAIGKLKREVQVARREAAELRDRDEQRDVRLIGF